MPKYQITDQQSGQTMLVEGDAPPTEADAAELFKSQEPQIKEAPSTIQKIGQEYTEGGIGGAIKLAVDPFGPIRRAVLPKIAPSMFSEEPSQLEPDKPRGMVPRLIQATGQSGLFRNKYVDTAREAYTVKPGDSVAVAAGKEALNTLIDTGEFALSPQGAAAGAAAVKAPRVVSALFSGQMFSSLGSQIQQVYPNWKNMTPAEKAKAVVDASATGLFAGLTAFGTLKSAKKESPNRQEPAQTTKETAPASENLPQHKGAELTDEQIQTRLDEIDEQRKSGAFSGRTREEMRLLKLQSERKAAGVKSPEEPGFEQDKNRYDRLRDELVSMQERELPDAELEPVKREIYELEQKHGQKLVEPPKAPAPVGLTPEGKALVDEHGKGVNIIDHDTFEKEASGFEDQNPFSGGRAQIANGSPIFADPSRNRVVINTPAFNDWLNSISPDRRAQAVKSVMAEEKIHLATNHADAMAYAKAMTGLEKWATKFKYGRDLPDDYQIGMEAIRYRMQQLMRLTPTEVAQEYGGKGATGRRLSIQAVDVLDRIVRTAREKITDNDSKAILDRVGRNLEIIKAVNGGQVVQTDDQPFNEEAQKQSAQLKQQADHYRKIGLTQEADELEQMSKQMEKWGTEQIEPSGAGGRRKDDKSQQLFDDLLQRSKWESMRAMINEGREKQLAAQGRRLLFKQAQKESGQPPTFEVAGAAGRGRPKREKSIYKEGEEMFGRGEVSSSNVKGAAMAARQFGETSKDLPEVPEGERALPAGQELKLPTAQEVDAGAERWMNDAITKSVDAMESGKEMSLPDFEDFSAYMQRNFKAQPGQVKDMFQKSLVDKLQGASGAQLESLMKAAFGKSSIIAKMRIPDAATETGQHLEIPPTNLEQPLLFGRMEQARKTLQEIKRPQKSAAIEAAKKEGEPEFAGEHQQGMLASEVVQRRRLKAISMIAKKSMGTLLHGDPALLARKEITPGDIRMGRGRVIRGTHTGSIGYEELSAYDEGDPTLGERLFESSRRSSNDKASITRRIITLRDKRDGSIHQVSFWRNPSTKRFFVTNPSLPAGEGLRFEDIHNRYNLVDTMVLDEPVEKFHRRFGSLNDYQSKFGTEARELAQSESSYDPMQVPISEFVEGTEPEGTAGVEPGGVGMAMGPHKGDITAQLGTGPSSFEQGRFGRITDAEARAVSRALEGAKSADAVKAILQSLGKESFDKVKEAWHKAMAKVSKAETALKEAEGAASSPPEDVQTERLDPKVEKARQAVRQARAEALNAAANWSQDAALRSGIAKIARRWQSLYGTKGEKEFDPTGKVEYLTKTKVPTEELLYQLSKSLYNASIKSIFRLDPVAGFKELGGAKNRPSPWDKTVTPTGRELTMLNRRAPTDVRPAMPMVKSVPPPDAMTPAPIKPVETLDGRAFQSIESSIMDPIRRLEASQNVVKFSPEELKEIEEEAAKAAIQKETNRLLSRREDIEAKQKQREQEEYESKNLVLKPQSAIDYGSTIPKPGAGAPPLRQGNLFAGAGGRIVEKAADRAHFAKMQGLSWLERGPMKQWVAAGYDALQTMARTYARSVANSVRALASEKGKTDTKMLGGAIAMHAAKAFKKNLVYDQDAIEQFTEREKFSPDIELADLLLTGDAVKIKQYLYDQIDRNPRDTIKVNLFRRMLGEINQHAGKDQAIRNELGQTIGWRQQRGNVPDTVRLEGARIRKEAERAIENDLLKAGWLNHDGATYEFDDNQKHKLEEFQKLLAIGETKARQAIANGPLWERLKNRRWLDDIKKHQEDVKYAKANWSNPKFQEVVKKASHELNLQYDREIANGGSLNYDDAYLPGRYDGEFFNNFSITFGPQILGRQYSKSAVFDNYYDAAATGPYVSASHDISNLVEHRVRQGMTKINKDNWQHEISSVKDPSTGQQAFAMAKRVKGRDDWVPDLPVGESPGNYVAVSSNASRKPVFALRGSQERLLKSLIIPSAIDEHIIGRVALQSSQALKHIALLGDIFHLGRVLWYSGSISGLKGMNIWRGANHVPAWAALEWREEDLPMAVKSGLLDKEAVEWLKTDMPAVVKGQKVTMTRMQAAKEFQKVGFNVGRISDAIYADLVHNIPGIGRYNKWLFDKFTRGIMMNNAISEFERIQKKETNTNSEVLMRRIGHDLNYYFGSIGKQGIFKSSTYQDFLRIAFLSPQWVEGIVAKDMAIPYKAVTSLSEGPAGLGKLLTGHETAARGIARGLLGMLVLTQVINLITRRQPTWNNEEGHQWEADIGNNVFINPLSVFNEMLHELIRYGETKPKMWDAIQQIGENKLGFIGRAALVGITDRSPGGPVRTTTMGVIGEMAKQAAPLPVTLGPAIQQAASMATGGYLEPATAANMTRSVAALFGIKAGAGRNLEGTMKDSAMRFVRANKLSGGHEPPPYTDEPSFAKLRHELQLGNDTGARQALEALRSEGKKENQIIAAMKKWEVAPFTGSRRNDVLWLHSLNPDERAMYQQAILARRALYQQWLKFYQSDRGRM